MRQPLSLMRRLSGALLLGLSFTAGVAAASAPVLAQDVSEAGFQRFVQGLWPAAKARGVSRATFKEAFRGVEPDPRIIALTKKQSEFVRPIWEYINGAISAQRLERGQEMAAESSRPGRRGAHLWGAAPGRPRRLGHGDQFRQFHRLDLRGAGPRDPRLYGLSRRFLQRGLLTALQILEGDHIDRDKMLGSWAGAMGQTQFMPSSFMKFAVDGNRDGVRDIWSSVPDALASTANYLRQQGWQPGLPWGFEVALPKGFDFRHLRQDFARWQAVGLRRADGKAMPRAGEATLFLPGGAAGRPSWSPTITT